MTWMNEWDIDNALDQWSRHPVLGPAVLTLDALRKVTNRQSDGWPYYQKPSRAASQLMDLIKQGETAARRSYERRPGADYTEPAEADLRKALRPVKAFRTRQGWDFEIIERLPTERERLSRSLMDAERAASGYAALADAQLARARDIAAELAELDI
jgi:hypothetical protein